MQGQFLGMLNLAIYDIKGKAMCSLPMECAKALWTRCTTASTPGFGGRSLLAESEDMDLIVVVTFIRQTTWCAGDRGGDAL